MACLKTLEKENARLKKLLAEKELDNDVLRENSRVMVSPVGRRAAVSMALERFGISQRRACSILGTHCSTERRVRPGNSKEEFLRRRIRAMALSYPRNGYRRIHAILIREVI